MAYTAKTWVTGEVIQASDLNHAEQGIAAISANGAIDTANLAIASVTNEKLDQEAVDSNNIRAGAINTPLIYDGAVTLPKLGADVIDELDTKADIDGSYESMTVGNAEQLISSVGIEDQTPYNFRTSGGSVDIGDRERVDAIVGGTIAWNQLVPPLDSSNYRFTQSTGSFADGVATFTCSQQYSGITNSRYVGQVIKDHVYIMSFDVKLDDLGDGTGAIYWPINNMTAPTVRINTLTAGQWKTVSIVQKASNSYSDNFQRIIFDTRASNWTAVSIKNMVGFDLTQMFGSTIADYIYLLEQANVGAGVAYFRKLFGKPYYAYNSGELLSVKTSAHKMVGFNAYDHSTGKAKVVGGNVYQITGTYTALSLNGSTITPDASGYFTPSESGEITVTGGNGTTTCIHLKWDGERDGEYEPFVSHEYALDDITLRGILKLDANNNLYADGDRYLPDGTVERRYGVVDLGTLNWTFISGSGWDCFAAAVPSKKATVNMVCGLYSYGNVYNTTTDKVIAANVNNSNIYVRDTSYSTAAAFKAAMSGVYLVYELETPTTESAAPYQQTQIVDDFGTEEFVDASVEANERDVAVPVGNETVYKPNLRAKLEMAPDSPDGDGDYIVRQTNGQNSYIPLVEVKELPDMPSEDGNYTLRCTVTNGTATLSWVSA